MSGLKKLAGQTAIYGVSSILGRMVNFLLVPFLTGLLPGADFGIMTELYVYIAFLFVIYTFGMETTYFRFANKEGADEQEVFNNCQTLVLAISVPFTLIFVWKASAIANLLEYPGKYLLVMWPALVLFLDAFTAIPFARLRKKEKAVRFASARLGAIFLNISLNIFFLYFCKNVYEGQFLPSLKPFVDGIFNPAWGVEYVLLANLLGNLVFIPYLAPELVNYRPSMGKAYVGEMISYAYPLVLLGLAGVANELIDRVLLKEKLSVTCLSQEERIQKVMAIVGEYGAVYKLSIFINLANQAFRYAAEPFFFKKAKDKNAPETFAKVMKFYVIFCVVVYLGVGLLRDPIGHLVIRNPDFWEGLYIVPILLLANVFLGIYYNLSVWYKLTDKTSYGTLISIIGAGVTLGLNFYLIPQIGYLGSAIATLACYFIMALLSYVWGQKFYPVPYQVRSGIGYLVLATLMIGVSYWEPFDNVLLNYSLYGLLIVGFLLLVYLREGKELRRRG